MVEDFMMQTFTEGDFIVTSSVPKHQFFDEEQEEGDSDDDQAPINQNWNLECQDVQQYGASSQVMDEEHKAVNDVYRVCEVQVLDQEGEEESKEAYYARV